MIHYFLPLSSLLAGLISSFYAHEEVVLSEVKHNGDMGMGHLCFTICGAFMV